MMKARGESAGTEPAGAPCSRRSIDASLGTDTVKDVCASSLQVAVTARSTSQEVRLPAGRLNVWSKMLVVPVHTVYLGANPRYVGRNPGP